MSALSSSSSLASAGSMATSSIEADVRSLIDSQLYTSALLLCELHFPPSQRAITCVQLGLTGDALVGDRQWRRAIHYYQRAIDETKTMKRSLSSATVNSDSERTQAWRLSIALCHRHLHDATAELETLEQCYAPTLPIHIHHRMATLYDTCGKKKHAAISWLTVLKMNPRAVDAALALARYQTSEDWRMAATDYANRPAYTMWAKWLHADHDMATYKHRASLATYNELTASYPYNATLLRRRGHVELQVCSDTSISEASHLKARQLDELNMDGVDQLALVLRRRGNTSELARLVPHALSINDQRAECWVAAALYADLSDTIQSKRKGLEYLDRAVFMNPSLASAYTVRAHLHECLSENEQSVQFYKRAMTCDHTDLVPRQGLVKTLLALKRHKEALSVAKESLTTMPKSPQALCLVGMVLQEGPSAAEQLKALQVYEKALTIDGTCYDALTSASTLHANAARRDHKRLTDKLARKNGASLSATALTTAQQNITASWMRAAAILERYATHHGHRDDYWRSLGEIYEAAGAPSQALQFYQQALTLNPTCAITQSSIEQLELSQPVADDATDGAAVNVTPIADDDHDEQ